MENPWGSTEQPTETEQQSSSSSSSRPVQEPTTTITSPPSEPLKVVLEDPQKQGEGIQNAYISYKVTTTTVH